LSFILVLLLFLLFPFTLPPPLSQKKHFGSVTNNFCVSLTEEKDFDVGIGKLVT